MKTVTFTIQKPARVDDGYGNKKDSWADTLTTRGKLKDLPTSSRLFGDKLTVFRTHQLDAPMITITEFDRIKIAGKVYLVKSIQRDLNSKGMMRIDLEQKE